LVVFISFPLTIRWSPLQCDKTESYCSCRPAMFGYCALASGEICTLLASHKLAISATSGRVLEMTVWPCATFGTINPNTTNAMNHLEFKKPFIKNSSRRHRFRSPTGLSPSNLQIYCLGDDRSRAEYRQQ